MTSDGETKFYTLEQVKIRNGKEDTSVWVVYKDGVYDVTDYLEDHPGGSDQILEYAGKDCTKAFDDMGHSGDARKHLKSLKIGEIVEEERKGKNKKKNQSDGPKVVKAKTEKPQTRSCISIITCGLCG